MGIAEQLTEKGVDPDALAAEAIATPELIEELVQGLMASKGTLRYGCEKVLRLISEQQPELVYPFFDRYVELLGSKNSFLQWGAILTIGNLAAVDSDRRFEAIFRKYYAPITGPVMVTAANIIRSSAKIISAKPELAQKITRAILKVEKAEFQRHGEESPECRNVAVGQAIDTFDQVFDKIENKKSVVRFVKRQLGNPRPAVAKKAKAFLARHAECT